MEKRTPDPHTTVDKNAGCHASQTRRIGLRPVLPHRNRFDLVVNGVGSDDADGTHLLRRSGQEPIARGPCSRLNAG